MCLDFGGHYISDCTPGYIDSTVELINSIAKRMDAKIILIPNQRRHKGGDDVIAKTILDKVSDVNIEILQLDKYTPNQVKAIISKCDIMVAARYHSIIASLSSFVPVLALSWHHKYKEVMKLFNLEDYVINKENINTALAADFYKLYNNKDNIKNALKKRNGDVKKRVSKGAQLFYKIAFSR